MKKDLLKDINYVIDNWNERSSFSLGGVKNLSFADLEILQLYVECFQQFGTYKGQLMRPLGNIEKVLNKYGYIV